MEWTGASLRLLDQTELPIKEIWLECYDAKTVAKAIVDMKVRGAPAIGAAAAYATALEANRVQSLDAEQFKSHMETTLQELATTRPTAVNLFWAIERMRTVLCKHHHNPELAASCLTEAAMAIAADDIQTNRQIGDYGAALFHHPVRILTHCNTGSLATVEYGTALGVIRSLYSQSRLTHVWVDETRPYLQGARLTAYELLQERIPHTLITDNMAAHFMKTGQVDAVIVGADRIAANGDTANKIGTYGLAVLCQHHGIPFYVAAPTSTFDLSIQDGEQIPIEERSIAEVVEIRGQVIAPEGTLAAHPAFDVTPHDLITAIITEHGVIEHPTEQAVNATVKRKKGASR